MKSFSKFNRIRRKNMTVKSYVNNHVEKKVAITILSRSRSLIRPKTSFTSHRLRYTRVQQYCRYIYTACVQYTDSSAGIAPMVTHCKSCLPKRKSTAMSPFSISLLLQLSRVLNVSKCSKMRLWTLLTLVIGFLRIYIANGGINEARCKINCMTSIQPQVRSLNLHYSTCSASEV